MMETRHAHSELASEVIDLKPLIETLISFTSRMVSKMMAMKRSYETRR
jgi:hypothetical protein